MDLATKWFREMEEGITLRIPKNRIKKKMKEGRSPKDPSTWKATCCECQGTMDFNNSEFNPTYHCRKCGNILEV